MSRPRTTRVRTVRSIFVIVLGAWLLSGCALWPMLRGGSARTGSNPAEQTINADNVSQLHKKWTDTTGAPVSSPVVYANIVYVVTSATLFAFNANGQAGCSGSPRTCTPLWTAPTGGANALALGDGKVLVAGGGQLRAFDANGVTGCSGSPKTCTPLWIGTADCESGAAQCTTSAPAIAGNLAYVGVTSTDECCLASAQVFDMHGVTDCSGSPVMCMPLRKYAIDCGLGFSCEASPPAIAKGVMYIASRSDQSDFGDSGDLLAFDATGSSGCSGAPVTCTPLWTAPTMGVRGSPAVAKGVVYVADATHPDPEVGSDRGSVRAYDAAGVTGCTGAPKICSPLWATSVGPIFGAPAVARGNVYVGSFAGDLRVLDAATGAPRWTGVTGHFTNTSPTVANDVVYVASNGTLFTFDADGTKSCAGSPKTCTSLRTVPSDSSNGHETVVTNGTVYVGGSNALRAFKLH